MASRDQGAPPRTVHRAPQPAPRAASGLLAEEMGRGKVGTPTRRVSTACHLATRAGAGGGGGGRAQHSASVAFISASRLLSSVASLHFPSTDTDFSPWKREVAVRTVEGAERDAQRPPRGRMCHLCLSPPPSVLVLRESRQGRCPGALPAPTEAGTGEPQSGQRLAKVGYVSNGPPSGWGASGKAACKCVREPLSPWSQGRCPRVAAPTSGTKVAETDGRWDQRSGTCSPCRVPRGTNKAPVTQHPETRETSQLSSVEKAANGQAGTRRTRHLPTGHRLVSPYCKTPQHAVRSTVEANRKTEHPSQDRQDLENARWTFQTWNTQSSKRDTHGWAHGQNG